MDNININSTILDIVSKYPNAEDFFRGYDERAGRCVLCHNLFDTIHEFSKEYDLDEKYILLSLEDYKK